MNQRSNSWYNWLMILTKITSRSKINQTLIIMKNQSNLGVELRWLRGRAWGKAATCRADKGWDGKTQIEGSNEMINFVRYLGSISWPLGRVLMALNDVVFLIWKYGFKLRLMRLELMTLKLGACEWESFTCRSSSIFSKMPLMFNVSVLPRLNFELGDFREVGFVSESTSYSA